MLAAPGLAPGRARRAGLASSTSCRPSPSSPAIDPASARLDGESLVAARSRRSGRGPVPMEYAAEGAVAPMVALRDGRFKLILCDRRPAAPLRPRGRPARDARTSPPTPPHAATARARSPPPSPPAGTSPPSTATSARARPAAGSSTRRSAAAAYYPWDYQPLQQASERYMRNHMDLNVLEATSRFPPPEQG